MRPLIPLVLAFAVALPASAQEVRLRGRFVPLLPATAEQAQPVGEARVVVDDDGDARIDLVVAGVTERITSATLHAGPAGEVGERIATFEVDTSGNEGRVIGGLVDIRSPMLTRQVRAGEAYVVVRTSEHPDGVLRAQLVPQVRGVDAVVAGD